MNVNQIIENALSKLKIPVSPLHYSGKSKSYITYNNSDSRAVEYADDIDIMDSITTQIHYFTKENPKGIARKIRIALRDAGFTYISTDEFYENDTCFFHTVITVNILVPSETEEVS